MKKRPLQFGDFTTRELWVASFAGVRGAITLAGVLSIPLLLSDGSAFPARYQLVFIAAGVILLSLIAGVMALPLLLRGVQVADKSVSKSEERMAIAMAAEVAIESINKMEERLAVDTEENIDPQVLKEISSRVVGALRRRITTDTKKGTPTSEVTMPTGTITPSTMFFEAIEASDRIMAPISALPGR